MSVVDEGFICPHCLVAFATSVKLQSHFVDIHGDSVGSTSLGSWGEADEDWRIGATGGYKPLEGEVCLESFRCVSS